jgi:Domain of unknown function (DUF4347)/FG-GAP-like repeat/Domain of unknown function (DUF4114)/FG-GAP repeat
MKGFIPSPSSKLETFENQTMNNTSMLLTDNTNQNLSLLSPLPTLVFIDSGIDEYELLVEGILPTAESIILERHRDGIAQITEILSTHPASNIQIIAHGSPGSLQLGNSQLNLDNLHTYRLSLQQWQAAEIQIYGCEVAAGERGQAFIQQLHQLTGTNIAASVGKIGNAQQGGTWKLEVKIGQIAATLALKPQVTQAYPGVLQSFANATNFSVGDSPYSVAVGDFNGDGKLDLAVTNNESDNVSILLGDGTGSFGSATNFSVGDSPYSVVVGDFNGDSKLDLVVANQGDDNVSILLGTGTGGFDSATNFSVGDSPYSVVVGDFNGDSKLDLAVANEGDDNVSILLGTGTGSFGSATNFSVGDSPYSVAVGDFNGDGKLDLAAANEGDNNVSVLLGDGTGGFGTATNFSVGQSPYFLTVGDFNGDSKLDLVASNNDSNNISVLLGDGTGGFDSATNFAVGEDPYQLAVGDFNGDGKLDLVVANYSDNNISVLLNVPKVTITAGSNPKEAGANGSFTITLDTPAPLGGLTVKFNTANSTATTGDYTFAAGTNITAVTANTFTIAAGQTTAILTVQAVADAVDPDEMITVNLEASPNYALTSFSPSSNSPFTVGSSPESVTVADFNSDGKLDLVTANQDDGNVSVLLGDGAGGFGSATNFSVGTSPSLVTLGDFNGDAKQDLAVTNSGSMTVSVLLGNGTGGFGSATNFSVGCGPQSVAVGDFNGDSKQDLAVTNQYSMAVSVLLGNGTGGFGSATNFTVGSGSYAVAVGDFNDDNKQDLVVTNSYDDNISVLLGDGTGGFGTATNFTVGNYPYSVAVGDFNGDGKLDLAVANNEDNNVSVMLGNGTGGFGSATNFSVGEDPYQVSVADFNGDGKLDLVTANEESYDVTVLLGDGTGGFGSPNSFFVGESPYSVAAGDFNGDGKLDLVAANEGDDNVFVLLNTPPTASLVIADSSAPTNLILSATSINENVAANTVIGNFTTTDADTNDTHTYSLVAGTDDTDNTAFIIDGNKLKIKNSPDFETKSSYKIKVRTTDAGGLFFDKNLTINVNDLNDNNVITQTKFVSLTKITEDTFTIKSQVKGEKAKLAIKLELSTFTQVNELGVFVVDDATGKINGIAPGAEGYAKAALERSQVIFSAIAKLPNGFNTNLESFLKFNSGENIRFFSVRNSSVSDVLSGKTSFADVVFATATNFKTQDLGDEGFSIGLEDFKIKIKTTEQQLPLGIGLQGKSQGEVIDLRQVTSQVKAEFTVNREAIFNNFVGFYQIADENGGIDTNGDGTVDLRAGDAGYTQAAINGRLAGIDLTVSNQGTATFSGTFKPGSLFAPFIIANGRPEAILDSNASNDPAVYFPFLGANSSNADHIRLLGNNTFGFEDLPGGGDKDYNDVIVKVNLSIAST